MANWLIVSDTYQSNGACQSTCSSYALGVLQGKKCWCTNVVPSESSQKATSKCDTSCPGYPDDSCGSAADGVFAYVSVGSKKPTSTEGGSSSESTTSVSWYPLLLDCLKKPIPGHQVDMPFLVLCLVHISRFCPYFLETVLLFFVGTGNH